MAKRKWDKANSQWLVEASDGEWITEAESANRRALAAHAQATESAAAYRRSLLGRRDELEAAVTKRGSVWVYDYEYVPVDSPIYSRPIDPAYDRSQIHPRGLDLGKVLTRSFQGWSIVATIPRTLGEVVTFQETSNAGLGVTTGFSNMTGLGGTVIGNYLVLGKQVTAAELGELWDELSTIT